MRPIVHRASLVEMAVPYGDPNAPFQRKCAFDVGDYGLGFCANSLALGCDCLGHIKYFDAVLNDSKGEAKYKSQMAGIKGMSSQSSGTCIALVNFELLLLI